MQIGHLLVHFQSRCFHSFQVCFFRDNEKIGIYPFLFALIFYFYYFYFGTLKTPLVDATKFSFETSTSK